jgi:hypothetical protein
VVVEVKSEPLYCAVLCSVQYTMKYNVLHTGGPGFPGGPTGPGRPFLPLPRRLFRRDSLS